MIRDNPFTNDVDRFRFLIENDPDFAFEVAINGVEATVKAYDSRRLLQRYAAVVHKQLKDGGYRA